MTAGEAEEVAVQKNGKATKEFKSGFPDCLHPRKGMNQVQPKVDARAGMV